MTDPIDEILSPVHVYCARSAYHYGFGVSAEQAFDSVKKAGADSKELKNGPKESRGVLMHRLPSGVVKIAVDNMGCLHWSMPEGQKAGESQRLVFDKPKGEWVDQK